LWDSCVGGRRYFLYYSCRRNPTGREFFAPAGTLIAVNLLTKSEFTKRNIYLVFICLKQQCQELANIYVPNTAYVLKAKSKSPRFESTAPQQRHLLVCHQRGPSFGTLPTYCMWGFNAAVPYCGCNLIPLQLVIGRQSTHNKGFRALGGFPPKG
jgi:hypothetical protein